MLKQLKDGTWKVESPADLQDAEAAVEERLEAIQEVEEHMEEEFQYLTMKRDVVALDEAIVSYMAKNDIAHVFRDDHKVTLVRRSKISWDVAKLKAKLPKNLWLKVTTQTLDREKLDDLIKQKVIDIKLVRPALTETPEKPHIRRYPFKEGQSKEDAMAEEQELRRAMGSDDKEEEPKPKRKGRK